MLEGRQKVPSKRLYSKQTEYGFTERNEKCGTREWLLLEFH